MILQEILRIKGSLVHKIGPDATVADAVRQLTRHNIGSLLVCTPPDEDGPAMLGIITERDILRAYSMHLTDLDQVKVGTVMTRAIRVASPQDSVEDTMGLMTEHRIRHLPVVEDGQLLGMISIGDVVKAQHHELSVENHFLKSYIQS